MKISVLLPTFSYRNQHSYSFCTLFCYASQEMGLLEDYKTLESTGSKKYKGKISLFGHVQSMGFLRSKRTLLSGRGAEFKVMVVAMQCQRDN